ncbi:collagen-like protein [Vibrio campbellii]|uniref:collagen-like protein n=1 Tax=Vibrio campbellii TaxID=680 RepID=UPI0005F07808|nr:collagen-like protein [Vibrio campbellii]
MFNLTNFNFKKKALCILVPLSISVPATSGTIFDEPHALAVSVFDIRTGDPIDDGEYYVEVDIIDNNTSLPIGTEQYQCHFFSGICSLPISIKNLPSLTDLTGISFSVSIPDVLDENSISYDVSNVSVDVQTQNQMDNTLKYAVKPVLYARVAETATNVTGDITPNSVDTSTISINGSAVINDNGEWVGKGAIEGPQGPKGDTGATGPQGAAGPRGATGAQGPAGTQGATGPRGFSGPRGYTGSRGATGPRGYRGYTGPRGPQGPSGVQHISYVSHFYGASFMKEFNHVEIPLSGNTLYVRSGSWIDGLGTNNKIYAGKDRANRKSISMLGLKQINLYRETSRTSDVIGYMEFIYASGKKVTFGNIKTPHILGTYNIPNGKTVYKIDAYSAQKGLSIYGAKGIGGLVFHSK